MRLLSLKDREQLHLQTFKNRVRRRLRFLVVQSHGPFKILLRTSDVAGLEAKKATHFVEQDVRQAGFDGFGHDGFTFRELLALEIQGAQVGVM